MKNTNKGWAYRKQLIYGLVLVVLAVVLIPQRNQVIEGVRSLTEASLNWLLLAGLCFMLTYLATAMAYKMLAKKPISLFKGFLVQIAGSFTNRVIPAGLGGLGLNADFLTKNKHSLVQAGTVVGVNSAVAILNHIALIIIAIFMGAVGVKQILDFKKIPIVGLWIIFFLLLTTIVFVYKSTKMRKKIKKISQNVINNLKAYKSSPHKIVFVYIIAGVITLLFVATLYCCAQAVKLEITFIQTFITYTVGVILGAAVLTPGGLGGVEAGMYGAFLIYNNKPSTVFATIIVYRLLTYWLPILPGLLSFILLRRNKQI